MNFVMTLDLQGYYSPCDITPTPRPQGRPLTSHISGEVGDERMTASFEFNSTMPALRAVSRRIGVDEWEGINCGWILYERARRLGRQISAGWVVTGTRRILLRANTSTGSVSLDVEATGRPLHEILAAEPDQLAAWQAATLDTQDEKILAASNTSEIARNKNITRRAAQQQIVRQVKHFEQGDFFARGVA